MNKITREQFEQILSTYDLAENLSVTSDKNKQHEQLFEELSRIFDDTSYTTKTIVGVDIYGYSSYPNERQRLIPLIYDILARKTLKDCIDLDPFLFQHYKDIKDFEIIPTGDGGFHIFDTPIHGLVFIFHFESNMKLFNTYTNYPKTREIIGQIHLRHAMTHDKLYSYENNFFGPAIINNARILKKDKLNRLLIDNKTYEWFLLNISGIETLPFITLKRLRSTTEFKNYLTDPFATKKQFILQDEQQSQTIKRVDVAKIGNLKSKETIIDIYNIHFQILFSYGDDESTTDDLPFVVSVGNLNTLGLDN